MVWFGALVVPLTGSWCVWLLNSETNTSVTSAFNVCPAADRLITGAVMAASAEATMLAVAVFTVADVEAFTVTIGALTVTAVGLVKVKPAEENCTY